MNATASPLRRPGSPADRGSADAYYHRGSHPHCYDAATGQRRGEAQMTPGEVADYRSAYDSEDDRKDWR